MNLTKSTFWRESCYQIYLENALCRRILIVIIVIIIIIMIIIIIIISLKLYLQQNHAILTHHPFTQIHLNIPKYKNTHNILSILIYILWVWSLFFIHREDPSSPFIQGKDRRPLTVLPVLPCRSLISQFQQGRPEDSWHRHRSRGLEETASFSCLENETQQTNSGYLLHNLPGKNRSVNLDVMVLKFLFQREDNEMLQNNTFRKWSLCDNASVSTFASVSYIDPCQVSSHHGIISIISFHYFPYRTVATYGCLLLVREVLAAAVGSLSAVFPTPYIPEN